MNTTTLRQSVRDTRHSKPDWTGVRDDQNATASGARPQKQAKQSSKWPRSVN
ncbi:MAG: hypothetical protein ABSH01_16075 [Terriglobia bacterium]|jgi:hypothetical protein